MPERLRFERELDDLGLRESQSISTEQERESGASLSVDFYDRRDAHLEYLGRLVLPSPSNRWQIRLIDRPDLVKIYNDNRQKAATSSDYAFSPSWAAPENKLFPQAAGLQVQYDRVKIEEQSRQQSLVLQVDDDATQKKQLKALFDDAKKTEKEQGFYIVVEVNNKERKARLYFLRANPVASSRDEFEFAFGKYRNEPPDKKIRFVPGDSSKQVIGTLHTHYIKSTPSVKQTTTTGTTWRSGGERVERIVHAVSDKDINAAKNDQIIVYAIEAKQIHKAMPNGKAINGMKRTFNVLTDALESFAGKTKY